VVPNDGDVMPYETMVSWYSLLGGLLGARYMRSTEFEAKWNHESNLPGVRDPKSGHTCVALKGTASFPYLRIITDGHAAKAKKKLLLTERPEISCNCGGFYCDYDILQPQSMVIPEKKNIHLQYILSISSYPYPDPRHICCIGSCSWWGASVTRGFFVGRKSHVFRYRNVRNLGDLDGFVSRYTVTPRFVEHFLGGRV